jgi:hypothetical protein
MPMTPAVATRTNPTIKALELAVLGCMSVMDDPVLVIVSPRVVVLSWLAFPPVPVASHPRRVMSRHAQTVMITAHAQKVVWSAAEPGPISGGGHRISRGFASAPAGSYRDPLTGNVTAFIDFQQTGMLCT